MLTQGSRIPPALAATVLTLLAATAGAAELTLEPCRRPGLSDELLCGTWEVAENPAVEGGRTIPLSVVVVPALGENPAPDPIFYLAGGPGSSAIEEGAGAAYFLGSAREAREIVLVDTRGTGDSAGLVCPYQETAEGTVEVLETFLPVERVRECRRALAERADLTRYTTSLVVDDLDQVRTALGYLQVNLWAGSYGTRTALEWMRRHPGSVRTAVLGGAVPTHARMPQTLASDTQRALDALFAECAADADCRAAFPDPAADLAAVLARLEQGPVTVELAGGAGDRREVRMTRNVFVQTLRYMLYAPLASLQVPLFLHRAAAGDFGLLAETADTLAAGYLNSVADGFYLSVTCSEDVVRMDRREAERLSRDTFVGDFRIRAQSEACAEWPRADVPEEFFAPVRSSIPTLIVTGERDPATPPSQGDEVARHLSNSRHLVIPDGAHSPVGLTGIECTQRLTAELYASGSVEGLDIAGCRDSIRRPPFTLALEADEPVAMSADELARFAGTYGSREDGLQVVVELVEGRLRGTLGEEVLDLVPVGPWRFKPSGTPPGTYLDFRQQDGAIGGLELLEGGVPVVTLERDP